MAQVQPWLAGEKPLLGDRIQLTTVAGTMVFAELAKANAANTAARTLALEGADAALKEKDGGIPQYGQGWTDDMFMTAAILARTGSMPERARDLDRAAQLLISYAGRLQQPDGIFNHATDGPAAWGRGNGFAAFGLMETLTAMPRPSVTPGAAGDLHQADEGAGPRSGRPTACGGVVDRPGPCERTATAMILTAMARGVQLRMARSLVYAGVDRAWRALAHIAERRAGGRLHRTGAGPTARYCFDRPAIEAPTTAAARWRYSPRWSG
jgi:rhamnogalacturonyl hydrolase YesR